ncbi:hypothetical protein [Ohtaekwangia koreensis]|uniref:Uncharacterized protein n=1 Tax=Ohtaekwangia koreensis TaxID=688867 RepID=A0A1T5LHK2_9BACT|nr:hypothetical protein [Ohtaekwangia koreensis]SKC74828.1 hypothetical protein SAMN05660236_3142 [Ohtaekwangia koreensis]
MTRLQYLLILVTLLPVTVLAQIRVGKLVIKKNEVFDLGQSDILVADTLIMMDSSRLVLNKLKRENFVRVKWAIFGNHCIIDGRGIDGKPGRNGRNGVSPTIPCSPGLPGRNGGRGLDGTAGINLFLYLERITMNGNLVIDLSGGNGGKGGDGGNGGGGSTGTVHCAGGDGANGGNAGQGGNGANGGTLTLDNAKNPRIKELIGKQIVVKIYGGVAGSAGRGGYHGPAGLGPSRKNGKDGLPGTDSASGIGGVQGNINFESN